MEASDEGSAPSTERVRSLEHAVERAQERFTREVARADTGRWTGVCGVGVGFLGMGAPARIRAT